MALDGLAGIQLTLPGVKVHIYVHWSTTATHLNDIEYYIDILF